MEQLILHLIGDYVTQSDWMANGKTSKYGPALAHAIVYSLPFLLLRPSWIAFAVILVTHFFIDRFRIAKYVCYLKNFIAPVAAVMDAGEFCTEVYQGKKQVSTLDGELIFDWKFRWENCKATGYPSETPPFLAVWLMIIADNTMHLTINFLALKYL